MLLNCGVAEDSWESLGLQGDPTNPFWRRSTLGVLWKEQPSLNLVPYTGQNISFARMFSPGWESRLQALLNLLYTLFPTLTHWKRLWCWEGLGAGGEGDDRGWDGWMASLTRWTEFEWTPGVSDGQGSLACHDSWGHKESDTTEQLNWTELNWMV